MGINWGQAVTIAAGVLLAAVALAVVGAIARRA